MKTLETYGVKDMMHIFGLSRPSVYRRVREALAGRGGLPIPIPTGTKRSLRWDAESVKTFLHNTNTDSTPPSMESAKERQIRHAEAMKQLERLGVKKPQREEE